MRPIRFKFAPAKAHDALQTMLAARGKRCDLHTILKACYFADKAHLNEHGRPIFGATYRAMKFGPVPLEIYEMAKGDPIWLAEIDAVEFPWKVSGYYIELQRNGGAELGALSDTDHAALATAIARSASMTFNERTAATHGPDWQAAHLGIMRYEDMLDETPDKAERIAYLSQNAPSMKL